MDNLNLVFSAFFNVFPSDLWVGLLAMGIVGSFVMLFVDKFNKF